MFRREFLAAVGVLLSQAAGQAQLPAPWRCCGCGSTADDLAGVWDQVKQEFVSRVCGPCALARLTLPADKEVFAAAQRNGTLFRLWVWSSLFQE